LRTVRNKNRAQSKPYRQRHPDGPGSD
jgi:hypothetical protein